MADKKLLGIRTAVIDRGCQHVLIVVTSDLPSTEFQKRIDTIFYQLFKFAVVYVINKSKDFIQTVLSEATKREYYDCFYDKFLNNFNVFFLFLTPVSVEGDRKYIVCKDGRLSIKDDIISPFNSNFSHKNKVFLFDGCLAESHVPPRDLVTSVEVESLGVTDTQWLPKNGNNLIAFSPFISVPREEQDIIGKWSYTFMNNIRDYVLPITLILDKTWDDVAPPIFGTQEPHYVSSMEPVLLHKYDLVDFEKRNSRGGATVGGAKVGGATVCGTVVDITLIYDRRPNQKDLEKALEELSKTEKSVWRDKFGARFKNINSDLDVSFATKFKYLIENMYGCGLPKSWRQVLEVLDIHPMISVEVVKDGKKDKVPVSSFVKAYMTDNYQKYIDEKQ